MSIGNCLVGVAFLVVALGAACGSDDPQTSETPTVSAGTSALPGTAGTAPQAAAGTGTISTAGTRGSTTVPTPTTAGTSAAGTGPAAAGTGPAAVAGTGATAGTGPAVAGGSAAGAGPMAGMGPAAGSGPAAGTGGGMMMGAGACCADGDCLCHGDPPSAPTNMPGKFKTAMFTMPAGCVHYPTDAEPPFAAVTISDGFGGSGGCGPSQTGQWGPLYASWGIVAMIINTGAGDQPQQRGTKLSAAVAALKMENMKSGSPLMGKLSGRYGTSGFSMGGGGTTFTAMKDPMLKSNVSIMA